MSAALVFGHATNTTMDTSQVQLTAAVIGVGGRGDPTAANIPRKLQPDVYPQPGYDEYIGVNYPASFFIDSSVAAGVPVLHQDITNYRLTHPASPTILVVGYSEGAIVAENEKRNLANSAIPTNQLSFLMIASPNVPNGGIFGRFPNLNLLIVSSNGPAEPSKYDTTYVTNEYDPYADFPAYLNPFSLANSLAAVVYVHPDKYYDNADLTGPNVIKTVVQDNGAGGTDTYYFIKAEHLPLLQLPRDISAAVGLTPLTEPFISAIEPVLRVLVDMGYTDRTNANPQVPTQFSLITPPGKIVEAVVAMPGAVSQGASNFLNGFSAVAPATSPSVSVLSVSSPQQQQQQSLVSSQKVSVEQQQQPQQPNQQSLAAGVNEPAKPGTDQQQASQQQLGQQASQQQGQPQGQQQSNTPSGDPKLPHMGRSGQSPFSLNKNPTPSNGKTNATQPGGRLANAARDALNGLGGAKPKPATPSNPSTSQSETGTSTGSSPSGSSQGQQSAA